VRACPGCRWTGRRLCNKFMYKYDGVCVSTDICVFVCMSMWAQVIVCVIAHSC
jgi:hypothetical protein